ncbi:MAG: FlgD immunoglobulin-like domain containing protein [Candidatus Poribacteria bacterium]
MSRRSVALAIVLLSLAMHANAVNRWRPSAVQIDGAVVRAVAVAHDRLYAATWGDGVFVSEDHALSWRAAGLPGQFVVAFAPAQSRADVAFAATSDGVYRMHGLGLWERMQPEGVARACAVDPVDSRVVYVGVDGVGVQRSDDGGDTWNAVGDLPVNQPVFSIAVDWDDPSRVYVGTSTGVYLSDTRGDSWRAVSPAVGRTTTVSVHPTDPSIVFATVWGHGILRSADRGETWDQVLDANLRRWLYQLVNGVAYDHEDPDRMYVGSFGAGVLSSRDGGDSWTVESTTNGWVSSLAVDPRTNHVYAGIQGDGVYRKDDGGQRWQRMSVGFRNLHAKTVRVDPSRPNVVYAGTWGGGVYRSEDAALTWTAASLGLTTRVLPDFTIHPTNPDRLYAATDGGGVYRSDDQGRRWAPMREGLVAGIIVAVDVHPTDPDIVYAGSEGIGIRRSHDQGDTWGPTGLDTGALWSISINPTDPNIILAGSWGFVRFGAEGQGILRSEDAGTTWVFVLHSKPAVSIEVDPTDHSVVYAGLFGDGVYRSDDTGLTWQPMSHGLRNRNVWEVAPDAQVPGHVYAATWGDGVFVSVDGAETWRPMNRGLDSRNVYSITMDPSATRNVYAGATGGVFHLRRSLSDPLDVSLGDELDKTVWGAIKGVRLRPNFPNPANPETWIPFSLTVASTVTVDITNTGGSTVRTFDLGWVVAGTYESAATAVHWDGRDDHGEVLASGVYFTTIRAGSFTHTRRIVLAR